LSILSQCSSEFIVCQYVFIVTRDGSYWFPDGWIAHLEGLLAWKIAYADEAEVASETARDRFERDRHDEIDFDLAIFEAVSRAGTNARTHPDANASGNRTTSNVIAQVFREQNRASLAR
jgi:hypothetical protein